MPESPIEYVPCALSAFEAVDAANRIYRKELIYADEFVIRHEKASYDDFISGKPGARLRLSVTDATLSGWETVGNLMLSRGVDVLVQRGHAKKDDGKKYGKVIKFTKKVNGSGKPALYANIQFYDDESVKEVLKSNVSIYAEPDFLDAKENKYKWPITHIAGTDYPMIPKLESYTAIAASIMDELEKETVVPDPIIKPTPSVVTDETLDTLLTKYGITVPANSTEDQKKKLLQDYMQEVTLKFSLAPKVPEKIAPTAPTPEKIAASAIPAVQLSALSRGRKAEIEQLVVDERITPAQRDVLVSQYCTDDAIRVACSMENGDGFEKQLDLLKLNEKIKSGSATGAQVVALSRDKDTNTSSLQADAKRRREEAEKQHHVVR